jgi:hypothetical protein
MRVYALCGGSSISTRASFFPDAAPRGRWTVPVPCYPVAHPRGHLLFDTGVHRDARLDPSAASAPSARRASASARAPPTTR